MKNKVLYAIVSLLALTGCGSMKNMSREDRAGVGAQIGAFVGWLFGGAVGNSIDDDIGGDIGAFVGTAVGGIAGAQIAANTGDVVRVEKRNPGNYTPSSHVLLPDLQIEDILLEEDSITRDDKINAGETCHISLVIVNNSFQDALDVEPIVKVEKGKHLKLSEPVKITKITRDDHIVLPAHLLLLWEVFAPKALEVAVSITRNINCHSIAPRFTGSFAAALAVGS